GACSQATAQQPPQRRTSYPILKPQIAARHEQIREKLSDDTVLNLKDAPLSEAITFLQDLHEIPVIIDKRALEDVGYDETTPVTANVTGVSLRSALKVLLSEHDLTYTIRDEMLVITSQEASEYEPLTRMYPAADLVAKSPRTAVYLESGRGDTIRDMVMATVSPDTWDEVGGAGVISWVDHLDMFVISQSEAVHLQVEGLFESLRAVRAIHQGEPRADAPAADQPVVRIYKLVTPLVHPAGGQSGGFGGGFGAFGKATPPTTLASSSDPRPATSGNAQAVPAGDSNRDLFAGDRDDGASFASPFAAVADDGPFSAKPPADADFVNPFVAAGGSDPFSEPATNDNDPFADPQPPAPKPINPFGGDKPVDPFSDDTKQGKNGDKPVDPFSDKPKPRKSDDKPADPFDAPNPFGDPSDPPGADPFGGEAKPPTGKVEPPKASAPTPAPTAASTPGPPVDAQPKPQPAFPQPLVKQLDTKALEELIRSTIEPGQWTDDRTVVGFEDQLIVRQTESVHQQIRLLLTEMQLLQTRYPWHGAMIPVVGDRGVPADD
ncbi:MAG: hypothetical protein QF805_04580, partial [Pirellulaceae bacterium]|nr:hypothetical protein [Pirellulaceae bacterium]